jgi:protein dithiol oxidoreductase (disulfide-forming)
MKIDRRTMLLAAGAFASGAVFSKDAAVMPGQVPDSVAATAKPYIEVGNYKDDANRVFMFTQYTCPYCASVWEPMAQWGATLPETIKFIRVPMATGEKLSDLAALAYYVVRDLAPQRINEFETMAYQVGQSNPSASGYLSILKKMKFTPAQLKASIAKQVTKDRMVRSAVLERRYMVNVTPTFAVGGRWITNANFTNGDYQVLTQILNGLVSMAIADGAKS